MPERLRIATFNLENFDDVPGKLPTLKDRIAVMRPQLLRIDADVLCLQEVNSQLAGTKRQLLALKELVKGTQYANYEMAHTVKPSGEPDEERNLVVLSRFHIEETEQILNQHVDKLQYRKITADPPEGVKAIGWERPILHVTLDIGTGPRLHVLVVHLKSRIPTDIAGQKIDAYTWRNSQAWAEGYFVSSLKRVGQALETRMVIDKLFDAAEAAGKDALIAVAGDFNSDADEVTLSAILGRVEDTGNPALGKRVMMPCELTIPEPSRFSLLHLGKGVMYDHILASRALIAHYRGAEIENELLPDETIAFRTDVLFPESDHAPVVAAFQMP